MPLDISAAEQVTVGQHETNDSERGDDEDGIEGEIAFRFHGFLLTWCRLVGTDTHQF